MFELLILIGFIYTKIKAVLLSHSCAPRRLLSHSCSIEIFDQLHNFAMLNKKRHKKLLDTAFLEAKVYEQSYHHYLKEDRCELKALNGALNFY